MSWVTRRVGDGGAAGVAFAALAIATVVVVVAVAAAAASASAHVVAAVVGDASLVEAIKECRHEMVAESVG